MSTFSINGSTSYLRSEYERQQALFDAQPVMVQRFLEAQAQRLANALVDDASQVHFTLPDRVVDRTPQAGEMAAMLVPEDEREQNVGGWRLRLENRSIRDVLRECINQLEQSPDQAVSASASLLRFSTAMFMVHRMLPAGRAVTYRAGEDELIPTIPVKGEGEVESAITSIGDAIVEQGPVEAGRGELLVPFVPAARRFFLPQWVALDDGGNLLAGSVGEAEAHQASMERFINILHMASSFAPYMVADVEYQRKRYGMLGQVINQGRALARYKTEQIILAIEERVKQGTLNRGLSISLPYYDDQDLHMSHIELEVIPAGRITFKAVFILRAARMEQAKVSQDTRLNNSTRKYLLQELELLEQTFKHFPEQVVR